MPDRFDAHMLAGLRLFARVGSVTSLLLGVSVLVGWVLDSRILNAFQTEHAIMSPRSAIGVIIGALSLSLRTTGPCRPSLPRLLAARVCAGVLFAGSLTLVAGHALIRRDLFDPLLTRISWIDPSVATARIAPTGLFCFALLGAALLLSEARGVVARRLGSGCTLAGLLIVGLSMLGYAYDVQELKGFMVYRTMALHTAVALFVLFLICLASKPERGWAALIASGQPSARSSRVQLLLVTVLPFLIGLVALRGVRHGLLTPGLAMAIVVSITVVALMVRILRDGSVLDDLEMRRSAAVAAQIALNDELEQRVRDRTASLALSEARLRAYFDNAPEGLLLLRIMPGNRFVIESISPSLRAMYHLGSRDVGDITLDALFDIGFGAEMPAQIAFCLQSGRPHRYTARREIAGTIRLLDVILAPVPAGPDEDRLIAASMRDVTDVEQREEQLRQSQKMDAVGQLTGGLAHDFNNLLTGITGSLELMSTRIAQGRIGALDRYIDTAQEAAQRAAALTHRLLAFSRRQTLDPRATEVGDVVDGMEELIRRTVGPAITVEVNADADLWTTLIDANQLENALLNLCLNARDAMPSGGRLSVTVANATTGQVRPASPDSSGEVPPGRYVRLSVIDTGTGMTPDVIARAFDPFFTTKPIGQGTGLGLSMIYGFVRQSGGHVQMASKAGEGTAVCLYLPRLEVLPVDVDTDLPVPLADLGTASHNEVVLVVDDELAVRTIVVEVLEELGYRTLQAEDAAGGLALLQSSARIDLLISDVGLPNGMNGRQMADAARIVRPELKVLFITGYAENAVLGDGGLPPGMQVLTKPFTMGRLTSRIETLLEPATVLVS